MGELIASLQRLQEIELELNRLRKGEDGKSRQMRAADRKIAKITDELHELERERNRYQVEADQLSEQVKSREESILKHRTELLKVRTNKDYSAILTAINTEKADTEKIERLALEKMGEVEKLQGRIDTLLAEQEGVEARHASAREALEQYRDETSDEREKLEGVEGSGVIDASGVGAGHVWASGRAARRGGVG